MDMQTTRGDRFSALVGAELKGAIRSRNWRAVDVAERIDVHEVTLSRYLNGHRLIPASIVLDAAEVIGMNPEEIVERAYSRLIAEMGPSIAPDTRLLALAPVETAMTQGDVVLAAMDDYPGEDQRRTVESYMDEA